MCHVQQRTWTLGGCLKVGLNRGEMSSDVNHSFAPLVVCSLACGFPSSESRSRLFRGNVPVSTPPSTYAIAHDNF